MTRLHIPPEERYPAKRPKMHSVRHGYPTLTPTGKTRRYTYGPVWCKNVLNGTARNHDKMIAHGLALRIATRSELAMLPYKDLMELVQCALVIRLKEMEEERKMEIKKLFTSR